MSTTIFIQFGIFTNASKSVVFKRKGFGFMKNILILISLFLISSCMTAEERKAQIKQECKKEESELMAIHGCIASRYIQHGMKDSNPPLDFKKDKKNVEPICDVKIGMTKESVLKCLGEPMHKAKTKTSSYGYEIWGYENKSLGFLKDKLSIIKEY